MTVRPLPPLPSVDPATAPRPEEPGYAEWAERAGCSPEGIDRGPIWASLHRTPAERLEVLERAVNDLLEVRDGRWPEIR